MKLPVDGCIMELASIIDIYIAIFYRQVDRLGIA